MMEGPTAEELLDIVRRFYPPGIDGDDPLYEEPPEFERFHVLLTRLQNEVEAKNPLDPSWVAFRHDAREAFTDQLAFDTTVSLAEPCYRYKVYMPGVVLGDDGPAESVEIMRSVLAPVYMIYASRHDVHGEGWVALPPLAERFHRYRDQLSHLLQRHMPARQVPTALLEMPIPDRAPWGSNFMLGQATLMHYLFGNRFF